MRECLKQGKRRRAPAAAASRWLLKAVPQPAPTRRGSAGRPGCRRGHMAAAAAMLALGWTAAVRAIDPPAHGPDPVVSAEALLGAGRASAWAEGATRWLLLEGQVVFELGTYGFRAERAVVRIDPERPPGRLVHHLALFLEGAAPLHGRGPVSAEADRLLVTASTASQVNLEVSVLEQRDVAPADALVLGARARFEAHRAALARPTRSLPPGTLATGPAEVQAGAPAWASGAAPASGTPVSPAAVGAADASFLPPGGVVSIDWDQIVARPGTDGPVALLTGGVSVVFSHPGRRPGEPLDLTLRCQKAVVFLASGAELASGARQFEVEHVRGVYLEDNVVVTNGTYTLRAPRVYYEPATDRAVVLDAVFYTWDVKHEVPIYVRAGHVRQHSQRSWSARDALVTTSAFAEPHFAIAASHVTFDLVPRGTGTTVAHMAARDIVPRVGPVPVGWWPGLEGDAADLPLRRLDAGYSGNDGAVLRTTWDLFALMQRRRPRGVDLTGQLDVVGEHGAALGANLSYDQPQLYGQLDSYLLPLDHGTDRVSGRDIDHDGDVRGFLHGQHRQFLTDDWELSLELAYVSDPTFLETFFREEAETAKPYETSIYLNNQKDDRQFNFLAQYDLMNFTPQTNVLEARGYTVEKLPELGYHRVGTSLLDDRLTYYTENRLTRMRVRAGRDAPRDRGFSNIDSLISFGIPNTLAYDDAVDATGVGGSYVGRFDTRHELQAPMKIAIVDVLPHAAGRVTVYDDDFEEFGGEDERERLWGSVGTRLHTSFSRTDDGVQNTMLDLNRLRHVVEPGVDLYAIGSTIDPEDIPVYDPQVEAIREGAGARFGLRNTLQTERGGPGRWRGVDWVVVNTDFVLGADQESAPLPRYFAFRPEYSTGGDHFFGDLTWAVSDTLALTGDVTHSFEDDQLADLHGGARLAHSPALSSYFEYENVDAVDSRLLSAGFTYQLTRKYQLGLNQRWDLEAHDSRLTELFLQRKLPRWTLLVVAAVDDIEDDQSIGVVLIPDGVRSSRRLGAAAR